MAIVSFALDVWKDKIKEKNGFAIIGLDNS